VYFFPLWSPIRLTLGILLLNLRKCKNLIFTSSLTSKQMHSLSKLAFCANTRYIFYLFSQVFSLSLSFSLSNNLTIYLSLSLSPQPPTHTHSYTHTLSVVCIFCFFYHHISLFIVYPLSPHPMAHAMVCTD